VSVAGALPQENARAAGEPLLELRGVSKRFGAVAVLRDISLTIGSGEFLTLLGESGSGKTTLLRLIAGFEQPSSGEIWMSQERLDLLPPYKRRVNTVFQHYALFPHLGVRENVAYGLRVKSTAKDEIARRVEDALRMVKMAEFGAARPATLSGGQQQRVALARALVNRPQVLLLDEPLSALDANLRKQMQSELKALQRQVGITFVFVTHDQEEAMALSDRIALIRSGMLEQVAAPREIYAHPATAYAAQFIGQTNLLRASVSNALASCGALCWRTDAPEGTALFSLRPEAIRLANAEGNELNNASRFRGVIRQQVFSGASEVLEIDTGDGQILRARIPASGPLQANQEFAFSPEDAIRVRD
jgi:spermidine/putrescine transport system ATP-binding protein